MAADLRKSADRRPRKSAVNSWCSSPLLITRLTTPVLGLIAFKALGGIMQLPFSPHSFHHTGGPNEKQGAYLSDNVYSLHRRVFPKRKAEAGRRTNNQN